MDMIGLVVSSVERGKGVCIFVDGVFDVSTVGLSFIRLATNWAKSSAVLALVSSDWQRRPLRSTLGDRSLT